MTKYKDDPNEGISIMNIEPNYIAPLQNDVRTGPRSVSSNTRPDSYEVYPVLHKWYLDHIEQYKDNPELYNQLLNNPYYIDNAGDYEPYWYEGVLGLDQTNRNRYYNQLKSDAIEWVSSFVDKYNNRAYDSAQAQVARESAAGINVDLSGGQGISPGDPGGEPMSQKDATLPSPSGVADGFQFLHNTVSTVISAIEMAFGMAQKFQGLEAGELSLLNSSIDAENNANGFVADVVARNFDPDRIKKFIGNTMSDDEYRDFMADVDTILNDDHLPRRFRKYWSRSRRLDGLGVGNTSIRSKLQSSLKEYYAGRYDFANVLSQPFYSDDFSAMVADISEYIRVYETEYDKLFKDYDFDKLLTYDKETGKRLGSLEGSAYSEQLKASMFSEANEKLENELWNNIFKSLGERNSWWSNLLMLCATVARAMSRNVHAPTFGISASVRTGGTRDRRDTYIHKD